MANETKLARILKHVVKMDDRSYKEFTDNRIRDFQKGKISFEWLKAFVETCDAVRELKE